MDLKKGKYGKNLSFQADDKIAKAINRSLNAVIDDYFKHSDETPIMTIYEIE